MIDVSSPNLPQDEANGHPNISPMYGVSVYPAVTTRANIFNKNMQEIIPGVFLGPFSAAQKHCLLESGIRYVVCVRQEVDAHFIKPQISDPSFAYLTLDIADNATENIIRFFPKVLQVLVHGNNGNSRSATLILAYIMEKFGLSYSDALQFVKEKRASINPNEGFLAQLAEYEPIYKAHKLWPMENRQVTADPNVNVSS
ncbi:hypothetical protein NQ317_009089 [Molorchus minor]|uniref:Uncharacterized protein n=1 Tax=Molorchus minor TaxID=1323400 RepID=A0ABQ9JKS6_9CUCU|nr:hypothetical protein NQ317_009089 [Molorchus minor]